VSRLDERGIEIERCNARRRAGREMHAVETAARWAKRRLEPPKRLHICFPVIFPALLEDWEYWPTESVNTGPQEVGELKVLN